MVADWPLQNAAGAEIVGALVVPMVDFVFPIAVVSTVGQKLGVPTFIQYFTPNDSAFWLFTVSGTKGAICTFALTMTRSLN